MQMPKKDSELKTEQEIRERIQVIQKNREALERTEPRSNHFEDLRTRNAKFSKLTDREDHLKTKLFHILKAKKGLTP